MNWYDDIKGRIFNIQRFSIHDGPGVRTIVFLKGCVLRCRWCCNPESQSHEIETMISDGKTKTVGQDITVREVMQEVIRDMPYYRRSGGGLTLSGGECLCQADFSAALLAAAKDMGINTAVESTACMEFEVIEKLLPYLDIKHMNSEKHKEFTKRDNKLILENAAKLAVKAKKLIIRVPVVPTFNDTEEEIGDIARFAAGLPNVKEIHLLPYHRLGQDKYEGLGREYSLKNIEPPKREHMERLADIAAKTGLYAQIGG